MDVLENAAASLLCDARRLRLLDCGMVCARQELDQAAGLVAALPEREAVPPELSRIVLDAVAHIDAIEAERAVVLARLLDTVPDRV